MGPMGLNAGGKESSAGPLKGQCQPVLPSVMAFVPEAALIPYQSHRRLYVDAGFWGAWGAVLLKHD